MNKIKINVNKEFAEAFASKNGGEVVELDGELFLENKAYDCSSKEVQADKSVSYDDLKCLGESISYQFKYLREELSYIYKSMQDHREGHLPKIKSKEQLKRAIKALGLDEEYKVEPQVLYASRGDGTLEVELLPKSK